MCNNANVKSEKQLFHRRYKTKKSLWTRMETLSDMSNAEVWSLIETGGVENIYPRTSILLGNGGGAHNT